MAMPHTITPLQTNDTSLKERLKEIFDRQTTVSAGSVQLVGLDSLREKIGARWGMVRDKVHIYVQRIMMSLLRKNDVWFLYNDDDYIIVFYELNNQAAQLICGKLIEEVHRSLLGDPDTNEIVVRTVVFDIDGRIAVEIANLGELLSAAGRKASAPQALPTLADGDGGSVDQPDTSHVFEERLEELRRAAKGHGAHQKPQFVYRALWDVEKAVFSTYRCVPACGAGKFNSMSGYNILPDPADTDAIFSLDCETLTKAIATTIELYDNNFRYFSCIPLHFESVANSKRRNDYIKLLKIIPRDVSQFIEFLIYGLPVGVPLGRLLEIKTLLRGYSRLIIPMLDHEERGLSAYAQAGMQVIGFRLSSVMGEAEAIEYMRNVAGSAHKNALVAYVSGIRSEAMFDAACKCGVRFLSGPFFGPDQEYPQHMRHVGKEEVRHSAEQRAALTRYKPTR